MESIVKRTIKKNALLQSGYTVIVGVSGGADSMTLLNVLMRMRDSYQLRIAAAHLNHSLRPESDSEAEFVRQYCDEHNIEFYLKKTDVSRLSKEKGISVELCGRQERYGFFESLKKEINADVIATAHHKNDNCETVLMHLLRGSGINGIRGIEYKHDGIIRPLLDVSRNEIEEYCKNNNIPYCTDKSNFSTDYTRNKIRLELIPLLEKEYNPSVTDAISKLSYAAKCDESFIDSCAEREYNNLNITASGVNISALNKLPEAICVRIIRKMTEEASGTSADISYAHIQSVYEMIQSGQTGKSINLPFGIRAFSDYGYLKIEKQNRTKKYSYELKDKLYIPEANITVSIEHCRGGFDLGGEELLEVTSRKDGDVFYPEGMKGSKKLKDYFIEKKIPRSERDLIPVIRCGDEILQVGTYRRDRRRLVSGEGVKIKIEKGRM